VETADPLEVGVQKALEDVQAASVELARLNDLDDVAETALGLALALTKSSVAFIGLTDETGAYERVYSRSADASADTPREETERLITSANSSSNPSICGESLIAGGETIGMIGVARGSSYPKFQRQLFGVFANHVAASIQVALLRRRRQEMVQALVNLRADVERSEKDRLVAHERAQSATRVEKAHELSVEALLAISMHARPGQNLTEFYERLGESVARLVGAAKVLFWQLNENGLLSAVPGGYGVDEAYIASLRTAPCAPDRDDLQSRVVFKDFVYTAMESDGSAESARIL